MTRKELEARQEFESALANESKLTWAESARIADLLCRNGATLHRLSVMECNGVEWNRWDTNESFNKRQSRHEAYCERRTATTEALVRRRVAQLGDGFGVILQGDPRGCVVKITVPSGKTNDWGREGICVPYRRSE